MGEKFAVFRVLASSASSACVENDTVSGGAGDVDLSVFEPKVVDRGTLRSIEMTICKRFGDGFVFKLVGLDHGETAEGVEFACANGTKIVVIVCCETEKLFAAHEHFVVDLRNVILVSDDNATIVADLHGVHAFISEVALAVFKRPDWVIVCNEEASFFGIFDRGIDLFRCEVAIEYGLVFVEFNEVLVFLCVSEEVTVVRLVRLDALLWRKRDKAEVRGFGDGEIGLSSFIEFHFKACQREKIFILKIEMGDHDVVVCIGDDGISLFHIDFFELCGCETAVRNGGVTMEVCFVKRAVLRQKIFFHRKLSFLNFSVTFIIIYKGEEKSRVYVEYCEIGFFKKQDSRFARVIFGLRG